MNKKQCARVVALFILFILSQAIFWKIVITTLGENKLYIIYQFFFSCLFTILSIYFTEDIELFNGIFERKPKLKDKYNKFLHKCEWLYLWFINKVMLLLCGINRKDEKVYYKKRMYIKLKEYDKLPLILRGIFPMTILLSVWSTLIIFDVIPINIHEWISEFFSFIISLFGFYFVAMNVKKSC